MRARIGLALALAVVGCTTGQSNTTPPVTSGPTGGTLKLAVGTVNFAGFGIGLNVLETFRGANGFTAVPINTATLSGPAGFAAPAGSRDPGSGLSSVPLGSAENQFVIGPAGSGTNLASADGFGIGPPSSSVGGQNFYPAQPQFADAVPGAAAFFPQAFPVYGGPPAFPPVSMVPSALSSLLLIPSGWAEGFYIVALSAPPPSGTYTLSANYVQNGSNGTATANAPLNAANVLSPLPQMQIASTNDGGAAVTVAVIPPGVTEIVANVLDANVPPSQSGPPCPGGVGAATLVFKSAGTQTIPHNLGTGGSATFCHGDRLAVYGYGFDYDDLSLGPPANVSPSPALPAQADMTIAPPNTTTE